MLIGVDANPRPLGKVSERIHRKPTKGGLPNVLFVQAAIEDLPSELDLRVACSLNRNGPGCGPRGQRAFEGTKLERWSTLSRVRQRLPGKVRDSTVSGEAAQRN